MRYIRHFTLPHSQNTLFLKTTLSDGASIDGDKNIIEMLFILITVMKWVIKTLFI